jgi:hypothetical protein
MLMIPWETKRLEVDSECLGITKIRESDHTKRFTRLECFILNESMTKNNKFHLIKSNRYLYYQNYRLLKMSSMASTRPYPTQLAILDIIKIKLDFYYNLPIS